MKKVGCYFDTFFSFPKVSMTARTKCLHLGVSVNGLGFGLFLKGLGDTFSYTGK